MSNGIASSSQRRENMLRPLFHATAQKKDRASILEKRQNAVNNSIPLRNEAQRSFLFFSLPTTTRNKTIPWKPKLYVSKKTMEKNRTSKNLVKNERTPKEFLFIFAPFRNYCVRLRLVICFWFHFFRLRIVSRICGGSTWQSKISWVRWVDKIEPDPRCKASLKQDLLCCSALSLWCAVSFTTIAVIVHDNWHYQPASVPSMGTELP